AQADDSAVRFLKALDETIALIAAFPDMGSEWESSNPKRAGLRYCLVKGFENYVVVYRRYEPHVLIT
ncbi:MAG: type II toxin-antitoxin system RelE/ParE family toxin, partial [Pseudomonadota bacterium]|nr:type II toxin-antitoxin system RelE/ParE family toxin [Pseudomonadota bacterium]